MVIVSLVIVFILNLKIGCPRDFDNLLKYMFHEDFPKNYDVIKESETTLFHYILGERSCSYEIKIAQSNHDMLANNLMGTKFWRNLHPAWNENPCPYLSGNDCDKNELLHINKVKGTGLICYASFKPSSIVLELDCYDY
jgi:hypothetical protein